VGLPFADALHLGFVQAVELVRIVRLLLADAIRTQQQRGQVLVQLPGVAPNVSNQPAHVGAKLTQLSTHPPILLGVGVATGHHRRLLAYPKVGLPQPDVPRLGRRYQLDHRLVQQLRVGRIGHVLLLNGGIHIDLPKIPLGQVLLAHRQADRLPEQLFLPIRPHPATPAAQTARVKWALMLHVGVAAEVLPVGIL